MDGPGSGSAWLNASPRLSNTYPVKAHSGNTTKSAPVSAACFRRLSIEHKLCSVSPIFGAIWTAEMRILRWFVVALIEISPFRCRSKANRQTLDAIQELLEQAPTTVVHRRAAP